VYVPFTNRGVVGRPPVDRRGEESSSEERRAAARHDVPKFVQRDGRDGQVQRRPVWRRCYCIYFYVRPTADDAIWHEDPAIVRVDGFGAFVNVIVVVFMYRTR